MGEYESHKVHVNFKGTVEIEARSYEEACGLALALVIAHAGTRSNPDYPEQPFERHDVPEEELDRYKDVPVSGEWSVEHWPYPYELENPDDK